MAETKVLETARKLRRPLLWVAGGGYPGGFRAGMILRLVAAVSRYLAAAAVVLRTRVAA